MRPQTLNARSGLGRDLVVLLWIAALAVGSGAAHAEKKVTLCHRPPGNPDNVQTISVGEAAVSAHLAHGDELGACPTGCQRNPAVCDDGNACTTDSCEASGECVHDAVGCEDGNPCTLDVCDAAAGCLAVPNDGAACDDGNTCTNGDRCAATTCRGAAIGGCCLLDGDCDDSNPCTVDSCGGGFCLNQPRDCAVADRCQAGFCGLDGACDTAPVSCDDGNVCTDDACDAAIGCSHVPTASPPEPHEVSCLDHADNDCDGLVDLDDPDCIGEPDPGGDG